MVHKGNIIGLRPKETLSLSIGDLVRVTKAIYVESIVQVFPTQIGNTFRTHFSVPQSHFRPFFHKQIGAYYFYFPSSPNNKFLSDDAETTISNH